MQSLRDRLPATWRGPALPVQLPAVAAGALLLSQGGLGVVVGSLDLQPGAMGLLAASTLSALLGCGVAMHLLGRWQQGRLLRIVDTLDTARDLIEPAAAPDDALPRETVTRIGHQVGLLVAAAAEREQRVLASALSDTLTSLPNRALLTERLRHTLALARRNRAPFCVAVLDLDRFKVVNDTLGHAAGDAVLREVARRLRHSVRETDTVARLGGDEFVALLEGSDDAAQEVALRIVEAMRQPLSHQGHRIDVGISIGVAVHPRHGEDDVTLLRHADAAMYRAKLRRTRVEVFDGETEPVRTSDLSLLGELRAALESGELLLEYQPKLDLRSGLIVGVEGLVRWDHPGRGRIAPAEFLPFAEQSGFMRELTPWVIRDAARFAAHLAERGLRLNVAVNVSARDVEHPSFASRVSAIIAECGLEPGRLTLEIAESGLLSEAGRAQSALNAVAALGVRLAADDFGTGYSTLKQLQQLPIHELKIDRSFVSGLQNNRGNQTIVRATIELARQLGLRTVAEGVESTAELKLLSAMGCDEIQGYFLAKAMRASEVVSWVEMRHTLYVNAREAYFRSLLEKN